jgi:hypothetical protein
MDIFDINYTTNYLSAIIPNTLSSSGSSNTSINIVNIINSTASGITEIRYNEQVFLEKIPNPIAIIYKE